MNVSSTFEALDLNTLFPFELDEFQRQAIAALNAGSSVVVCAPTGAGKTLIGEYAIHRALYQGGRVFYTTPLKALSNQKFRDFRQQFGANMVGLLTGDVSVNREAPILVMTTEIFRNMLYGTRIGEVGTSLVNVEAVVLDECHYMNDRQRGTVWEESIIYCPGKVQLVALSATVANSGQLTDWIAHVHGPTELIYSDFRPVPLEFHFGNPKGLFPLLDADNKKVNPRLKQKGKTDTRKSMRAESPSIAFVVSQLAQRDMLPAIYFIFSRRGCDKAVDEFRDLTLVNEAESAQIKLLIDEFLQRNPEAARSGQVEPLSRGIAVHHAGILPAWKGLVEELFGMGLIKVVFATETLAAGINMPARTTVISSLSKRTDDGHRLLKASEFLQMSGRAGRRGMDTTGHVVTLQTPFEGAKEAAYLATAEADPLKSQFTPTYGMVLNLLQTHSLEEARGLVERSFGQYMAMVYLRPYQQSIADLKSELAQVEAMLAPVDPQLLSNYEKLQAHLKEERRIVKLLQHQADEVKAKEIGMALAEVPPGTILSIKGKHVPLPAPISAVLVTKASGSGHFPYLVCLGQDNRWYVVAAIDIVSLYGQWWHFVSEANAPAIASLQPPQDLPLKLGQIRRGTDATAAFASLIPSVPPPGITPEVRAQQQQVEALKTELDTHPLWQWGNPSTLLKRQQRRQTLQTEINQRQASLEQQLARHWQEFQDLIEILQRMGGLQGLIPTPLGEAAAAIRGDNELWLGLAMMSGTLDNLDPHHLAAAVCALVSETPRPDSWTNYVLADEVVEALKGLAGVRRQLFQLQRRQNVALPVWLEYDLIGIVEQWALGVTWLDLCDDNTNLDEGDIVRMLRRTVDLLSQIPHVPHISNSLQRNAIRAIQLIDRFPVNEVVTRGNG